MKASTIYPSPVGDLLLTRVGDSLTGLSFLETALESRTDTPAHIEIVRNRTNRLQNPLTYAPEAEGDRPTFDFQNPFLAGDNEGFAELMLQLDEYFVGQRQSFELSSLALRLDGTDFQKRVWQELCRIPYGQTISYGELARRLGQPNASRAVGLANGRNPISILIPCHRVIGANGKLVGYGGGLDRKKKLLEIETVAS